MKSQNRFLFSISFVIILGLAGCASYQPQSLKRLTRGPLRVKEEKENTLSVAYHVFTRRDCKKYLDRDVIKAGYQPVQITIVNNSGRHVDISTKRFSFTCVDFEEVAKKVHTSTVSRAAGYGVLGVFIWPFIIPAVVDGVGSAQANQQLDQDFARKALGEEQVLSPFSTINGLVFIPRKEFNKKDFEFTMIDVNTKEQFVFNENALEVQV